MQTPNQILESGNVVSLPVEYAGQRLEVFNFAQDRLLNDYLDPHHVWEPWQIDLMRRIIKPESTCVDVGANIGINAMFAARFCPRGRVLAYEPFGATYRLLVQNIEKNGLSNVLPLNKGLSDAAAALHMVADVSAVMGAHITNNDSAQDQYATTIAHFERLDDQMREHGVGRIDFIKIDVEGHELKVLAGGESFLSNPDLQMTIEFSPKLHLGPDGSPDPFADRNLFDALRTRFKHLFYMTRESTLVEIDSWHALRRRLLGGYYVDDLYCTNTIRAEISDLIVPGQPVASGVPVMREKVGEFEIEYTNRDPDGWAMADAYNPAVVGLNVKGSAGQNFALKFDPIHRKHLAHAENYPSWPVFIMAASQRYQVDLLDSPRELRLTLPASELDITLQSEHAVPAGPYLGNPNDPRSIGFRVTVG